jgi:hypothetical protein
MESDGSCRWSLLIFVYQARDNLLLLHTILSNAKISLYLLLQGFKCSVLFPFLTYFGETFFHIKRMM